MYRCGTVRDSIEMVEVNQVEGVSMRRKLLALLMLSVLFASVSTGALSLSSSEVAAAPPPMDPATRLVIDSPSNGSYLNSFNITISWHMAGPAVAVEYYLIQVDEGSWINNSQRTSITLIIPLDGVHFVKVQAVTDLNLTFIGDVIFVVDTVPPAIIEHAPTGGHVSPSSTIIVQFSEDMYKSSVGLVGVDGHKTWNENICILTPNDPLVLGQEYTITVYGQDLAGNNLSTFSWTFSTTSDGSVRGQVKDVGNNTIAGAEVTLRSGDMEVATTSTDSDGAFQITAPMGKYNLTISKPEIVSFTVPVDIVSGEELDLGVIEVEQAPDYQWVVIDTIIIIGAIGLFWVGRRNQRLGKR
jgi:hypothetical protein